MSDGAAPSGPAEPLSRHHELAEFRSGETELDEWLRRRALGNAALGASSTYVVCAQGSRRVVGFYALSMGQILNREATGALRRNMPRHIPAVVLGRLAVDLTVQRHGLGAALLRDATFRASRAAADIAARILLVQAISPAAEAFYLRHGFVRLPLETPTLALDLVAFAKLASAGPEGGGVSLPPA